MEQALPARSSAVLAMPRPASGLSLHPILIHFSTLLKDHPTIALQAGAGRKKAGTIDPIPCLTPTKLTHVARDIRPGCNAPKHGLPARSKPTLRPEQAASCKKGRCARSVARGERITGNSLVFGLQVAISLRPEHAGSCDGKGCRRQCNGRRRQATHGCAPAASSSCMFVVSTIKQVNCVGGSLLAAARGARGARAAAQRARGARRAASCAPRRGADWHPGPGFGQKPAPADWRSMKQIKT
jgi:hypothetical protein